jgi:DnaJ homolog subfamily A member 2
MSKPSLYDILELTKTASDDDIKKAFKKAAVKYHPDRNPSNPEEANAKFIEARKAFNTLSDPQKRKNYDQFGVIDGEEQQGSGMPGGFNPFDIFGMFNGGGFPGFGGPPHQQHQQSNEKRHGKSPDKKITINVSLADVYNGRQVPINFTKLICCDECQGRGTKSADNIKNCTTCNGNGRVMRVMQMGPMVQQTVSTCNACKGKGKMITPGSECTKCKGTKSCTFKQHLDCYIRPGSNPGSHITFKNESDWNADFTDIGDLVVFINCKNEEGIFKREGDNLIMTKSITLLEALTTTEFRFKHLDERVLAIKYTNIIKPNQRLVIKREGMPHPNDQLDRGDLIIQFDIVFPTNLESERSKYLVKILPSPKKQIWDTQLDLIPDNDITPATLEPFNDDDDNIKYQQSNEQREQHDTKHQFTNNNIDDDFTQFANGTMPGSNPIECTTQ